MVASVAGRPVAEHVSDRSRFVPALWARATAFYLSVGALTGLLAVRAVGLTRAPWNEPLVYSSDSLSGAASFKNVMENGWYEYNPHLGAPSGQQYHDFPLADNLHLMAAHVLGWFTDDWPVAYNVYYLLTYVLAAMAGAWFIRVVGGSWAAAFVLGILFAFAPYHFWRNEIHLYLSAYYPVPLAAGLVYRLLTGVPLWGRRASGHRFSPLTWLTWRSTWTVLIMVLMGTASTYYSVFTLLFAAFVLAALALQRHRLRAIGGGLAACAVLGAVMVANMLPDLLYSHGKPANFTGLTRAAPESEIYAFKFAQLVLPVDWERIGPLAALRQRYETEFPLPSEVPMLGAVAAAGFLFLLAIVLVNLVRGVAGTRNPQRDSPFWVAQRSLAFLSLAGFLIGTVGGLSTLFALLVSDSIRGWNRIAIFLSIFALASVALVFDRGLAWLLDHRRMPARVARRPVARTGVVALAGLVLLGIGCYDQIPPLKASDRAAVEAAWHDDDVYVRAIEAAVPAETMIFQLPYTSFPENGPLRAIQDYDPLRPYLHSTQLRWSFGGLRGRPLADWAQLVAAEPTPRMLVELAAAGFGGIHVDRGGYAPGDAEKFEADLGRLTGSTPIVSPSGRFAFYDLSSYRAALSQRYSAAELADLGSHATAHPVAYWQNDFTWQPNPGGPPILVSKQARPKLSIDNPRDRPSSVHLSLHLTAAPAGQVAVSWPDGLTQIVDVPAAGLDLERTLDVGTGRTTLGLAAAPGTHPPATTFTMVGMVLSDTVVASFPLR